MPGTRGQGRGYGARRSARELGRGGIAVIRSWKDGFR
jgi:hypothetical protein